MAIQASKPNRGPSTRRPSISPCWRRRSRSSRWPTATSACAATSTRASRAVLSGTYLNGLYESYPLQYGERGFGFAEDGQAVVNVTDGKIIRLLVEDEPFDVHRGPLGVPRARCSTSAPASSRARRAGAAEAGTRRRASRSRRLVSFVRPHRCGDPLRGRGARAAAARSRSSPTCRPTSRTARRAATRAPARRWAPCSTSELHVDHGLRVVLVHRTQAQPARLRRRDGAPDRVPTADRHDAHTVRARPGPRDDRRRRWSRASACW